MKLPEFSRPRNTTYRQFIPGLHLPSWFYYDLKAIDPNLHVVWHPHRVIWDDIINLYVGGLEDPRYHIHQEHGQEQWGFVLTDRTGAPIPEPAWHIWRLCWPYGWAHILRVEAEEGEYLNLLIKRLHLQAHYRETHGDRAWNQRMREDQAEAQQKAQDQHQELFDAVQDENAWLTKKAMENFASGKTAPTNPTKDQVISYTGQKNRSRIIRPLDDEEGGLVGFD